MRFPLLLVGALLLACGGLSILALPPGQTIRMDLPILGMVAPRAGGVLFLLWAVTALAAATATAFILRHGTDPNALAPPPVPLLARIAVRFQPQGDLAPLTRPPLRELAIGSAILAGLLLASALGHISLPRALVLAAFLIAAIVAAIHAMDASAREPVELRSNWGGLGGGLGGWRLSRPAVLLLLALALAGAAVAAALPPAPAQKPPSPVAPSAEKP